MTFPKEGRFAKDTRTKQVVRVTAEQPNQAWLVQTVCKSDPYRVYAKDLEPADDPQPWTRNRMAKAVVATLITMVVTYSTATQIHDLGGGLGLTLGSALLISIGLGHSLGQILGVTRD